MTIKAFSMIVAMAGLVAMAVLIAFLTSIAVHGATKYKIDSPGLARTGSIGMLPAAGPIAALKSCVEAVRRSALIPPPPPTIDINQPIYANSN